MGYGGRLCALQGRGVWESWKLVDAAADPDVPNNWKLLRREVLMEERSPFSRRLRHRMRKGQ